MYPKTSSIAFGDNPAEGSSNNKTSGFEIKALPNAQSCLCPPDKLPALSFLF